MSESDSESVVVSQVLTWGIPASLPGIPRNPWEPAFRPNPSRIPLLPVVGPIKRSKTSKMPQTFSKTPKNGKICAFGARIHRSERPGILPRRSV